MAKRMGTYRVDEDLLAAVAVKTAQRGETVTDLIIQRFEAYIRDDEAAPVASVPPVAEASVYTEPESPGRYGEPREEPPCKHPADRVDAGECQDCGADVW